MLEAFIAANRDDIIARARARVDSRTQPKASGIELRNGVPVFLDQLCRSLHLAQSTKVVDHEDLTASASQHGQDLLGLGLTVDQVVREYGDVCQVITQLAMDQNARIDADEFQTLNLCLDEAIANAVTEYTRQRDRQTANADTERLGVLAHEMRNLLNTAVLSYGIIKDGQVSVSGSTGLLLGRSLSGLRDLLDRSLADVRLDAGIMHTGRISVTDLVEELGVSAQLEARSRAINFEVSSGERGVMIDGDRQILVAAVSNLLQNAFKFTPANGNVSLRARVAVDRVFFEVEDECGGLPGDPEKLFRAFEQQGADRSGVGLGLSICRKAAKANGGEVYARNLPDKGCVFTLDLPRVSAPD
ncbi:MAG: HAMP domain-containing sensor histidine kinase [Polyangiaceae bacterium]